jgi:hypothetical protein
MEIKSVEYLVLDNKSKAKALIDIRIGDTVVFIFMSSNCGYANSFKVVVNGSSTGLISANVLGNTVFNKRLKLEVN